MTAWYREPGRRLLHRGRLDLGVVSGACGLEFAPVGPEITLPPGESPPERGCPECVTGRLGGKDCPAWMAALARAARRRLRLGWAGLAAVITVVVLVGFVILAWPR